MSLSEETRMQRRRVRAENQALRAAGVSVPVRRRAYRVEITAIPMPQWAIDKSLKAVSSSDTHVWLRSRSDAKRLAASDKWKGGAGSIDVMEYRRCLVCKRLLLGREAAEMCDWQRLNPGQKKQCEDCKEEK